MAGFGKMMEEYMTVPNPGMPFPWEFTISEEQDKANKEKGMTSSCFYEGGQGAFHVPFRFQNRKKKKKKKRLQERTMTSLKTKQ